MLEVNFSCKKTFDIIRNSYSNVKYLSVTQLWLKTFPGSVITGSEADYFQGQPHQQQGVTAEVLEKELEAPGEATIFIKWGLLCLLLIYTFCDSLERCKTILFEHRGIF